LPIPKHYIDDKRGWIPIAEKEPTESGLYIISEYGQKVNHYNEVLKTIKRVGMVYYQAELMKFLGSPDVIAWMEIPKLKPEKLGLAPTKKEKKNVKKRKRK